MSNSTNRRRRMTLRYYKRAVPGLIEARVAQEDWFVVRRLDAAASSSALWMAPGTAMH